MYGKLKKNIGIPLLFLAFVFLFEPNYTLVDILPDFIGYFLLCLGLSNLADINPRIEEAVSHFKFGILISLLKYLALYLKNGIFSAEEQSLVLLIFVFVFDTAELVILIPAYKKLFDGLTHLGTMQDSKAVFCTSVKKDGKGIKSITEKAYAFTVICLLVSSLATTVPELTSLIGNSYYDFIVILRVFLLVLSLAVGIFWLSYIERYFVRLKNDKAFINRLGDIYLEQKRENPDKYTLRRIKDAVFILTVGAALTVCLYVDNFSLIPKLLPCVILSLGILMLRKESKSFLLPCIFLILSGITALFADEAARGFYAEFEPYAVNRDLYAYKAFYSMAAVRIAAELVFFAGIVLLVLLLRQVFLHHSGISSVGNTNAEAKRSFGSRAIFLLISSALFCAGSIFQVLAQPFYRIDGKMLQSEGWFYYYSTVFAIALSIIFAAALISLLSFIGTEAEHRYRIEQK